MGANDVNSVEGNAVRIDRSTILDRLSERYHCEKIRRHRRVPMSIAASTRHGPFYAFSFRNFRIFFVGQLISVAGSWMQMVAQQWLVYDITHSSAWLGIVSGASAIPYVLFSLPGGKTADRRPRRVILIYTQTASMILAFILAALASNRWVHI